MKTALHWLSHAIFWIWNLAFIGIIYFWLLPTTGIPILESALMGEIPPAFVASILGLLIVPVVCTALGAIRLRKHPILLMRLFYGVEAPLFGLCLLRLFLIRETTPASAHVLITLLVAIAAFAIEVMAGYAAYRRGLAWVQMVGHSLMLVTGLYAGILLAMYTVPVLCMMLYGSVMGIWGAIANLSTINWASLLANIGDSLLHPGQILLFLGIILFWGLSCTVFLSLPYVIVNFYLRSWHRIRTAFARQHGHSWLTTGVVVGCSWLLFGLLQLHQPQAQAFSLLDGPPPQTPTDRLTLIDRSATIRKGLVHGYLFRYRYLGTTAESNQLREMYKSVFGLTTTAAQSYQDFHNALLAPFLYQGDREDADKAEALYADFFDAPIQKSERNAIRQALRATANRDETEAGVLNLDQKVVRLAEQTVTVKEHGDWAEVELYEQYENKTIDAQEIFYSFSLPESAAITGLWLAETKDSPRFPFVVSPRGAAQQVYKGEIERAQTRRAEDPALLEQVGPRQYRLRVFPIPAATSLTEPGQLHLWMTYRTLQQEGAWPLPQLTEKRNIFWTNKTLHQRRGKTVNIGIEDWFEPTLNAQKKVKSMVHQVNLPGGYQVTATPTDPAVLPQGKRIAAILDTSRSMDGGRYMTALLQLEKINDQNIIDFYRTTATGEGPVVSDDIESFDLLLPYGSLQPADMLQQFVQAQPVGTAYDAIVLLTDAGSYELTNETEIPQLSAPLWLVHMRDELPAAYDDNLLEAIQASGGGVATDVTAVLRRLERNVIDGYGWSVATIPDEISADETAAKKTAAPGDGFAALAARQLIGQRSRTVEMTQVENLDGVHAIAKRAHIVTPYSSMLVLVNDRQRELLRQAEAASDRFDREIEDGQDELTDPNNPLNAASVPEPGSMVAMGLMAVGLMAMKRKQPRRR